MGFEISCPPSTPATSACFKPKVLNRAVTSVWFHRSPSTLFTWIWFRFTTIVLGSLAAVYAHGSFVFTAEVGSELTNPPTGTLRGAFEQICGSVIIACRG